MDCAAGLIKTGIKQLWLSELNLNMLLIHQLRAQLGGIMQRWRFLPVLQESVLLCSSQAGWSYWQVGLPWGCQGRVAPAGVKPSWHARSCSATGQMESCM